MYEQVFNLLKIYSSYLSYKYMIPNYLEMFRL